MSQTGAQLAQIAALNGAAPPVMAEGVQSAGSATGAGGVSIRGAGAAATTGAASLGALPNQGHAHHSANAISSVEPPSSGQRDAGARKRTRLCTACAPRHRAGRCWVAPRC